MNRYLKHLLCSTGICVALSLIPAITQAQSNDSSGWNDLDFGIMKQQPKVELPVPPKPTTPGVTKTDETQKGVESLKIESPKNIKPLEIPSARTQTADVEQKTPTLTEDVTAVEEKPIKRVRKGESKKPVEIKSHGDETVARTNPTKKYLPHEKIKLNNTLSTVLARDEEVEKKIKVTPNTRWKYENKEEPKKFFVDRQGADDPENKHLPRLIYQKEYSELLFAAIDKDDVGAIKTLLANRADINSRLAANGYSTVMQATKGGQLRSLRYLILKGADTNLQDKDGKTAMHIAASEGKVDVFNVLAAAGANAAIKDYSGKTALDYAAKQIRPTLEVTIAQTAIDKNKALFELVGTSSTNAVSKLIDSGANVNAVNSRGQTPLIVAANNNDANMVHLLLAKGANPDLRDKNGDTAIKIATKNGNAELAQIIDTISIRKELEYGVSTRVETKPLEKKAAKNKKETVIFDKKVHSLEKTLSTIEEKSSAEASIPHYPHEVPMDILEGMRTETAEQANQIEEPKKKGFFESLFGSSDSEEPKLSEAEEAPKKKTTALERHKKVKAAKKAERQKKVQEMAMVKTEAPKIEEKTAPVEPLKNETKPHIEESKATLPEKDAKPPVVEPNSSAAKATTGTVIDRPEFKITVEEQAPKDVVEAPVQKTEEVKAEPLVQQVVEQPKPVVKQTSKAVAKVKKPELPKNIVKKSVEQKEQVEKMESQEIAELPFKNPWKSISDLFSKQSSNEEELALNNVELPTDAPVQLLPN